MESLEPHQYSFKGQATLQPDDDAKRLIKADTSDKYFWFDDGHGVQHETSSIDPPRARRRSVRSRVIISKECGLPVHEGEKQPVVLKLLVHVKDSKND